MFPCPVHQARPRVRFQFWVGRAKVARESWARYASVTWPWPAIPLSWDVNYRNPREDPLYGIDNALVTANWPAPPDPDPPSSLTGQVYACASTPAPLVVTEPHGWIWAGTGARPGMELPGLIGHEFDTVDLSQPTPRPIEILARSPQTCAGSGRAVSADVGTESWSYGLSTVAMVTDRCLTTSAPAVVVRGLPDRAGLALTPGWRVTSPPPETVFTGWCPW